MNENRRRSRWTLLLVAFAFATPFLLAVVLRFGGWEPADTRNLGDLIDPPYPMHEVRAERPDGSVWVFENTEHHWSLLARAPQNCDAVCVEQFSLLVNVQASMGRHRDRISRFVIGQTIPATGINWTALQLSDFPAADLSLPPSAVEAWLVDPHGYVVLHYPSGFAAQDLRRDLGRLIK